MNAAQETPAATDFEDQPVTEHPFQKWAIWVAFGLLLGALLAYLANFHGGFSDETSAWGEFGDYLGGLVNPIVGFLTICLLTVSLRQNQLALQQAREELKLARKAIEQAKEVQQATERALAKQISIAEQTRDFENAATLYAAFTDQTDTLTKQRSALFLSEENIKTLDRKIDESKRLSGKLGKILFVEAGRLIKRYSHNAIS